MSISSLVLQSKLNKSNGFFEILPEEVLKIITFYIMQNKKDYLSLLLTNKFLNQSLRSVIGNDIDNYLEDPKIKLLLIKNKYINFFIAQSAYAKLRSQLSNLYAKKPEEKWRFLTKEEWQHVDEALLKLFAKGVMVAKSYKEGHTHYQHMYLSSYIPKQVKDLIGQIESIITSHATGYFTPTSYPFELTFKTYESDKESSGMESLGLIRYADGNTMAHLAILLGNINPKNPKDKLAALINYCLANGNYLAENYQGHTILDFMLYYWSHADLYCDIIILPDNLEAKVKVAKDNLLRLSENQNIEEFLNEGWQDDFITMFALARLKNDPTMLPELKQKFAKLYNDACNNIPQDFQIDKQYGRISYNRVNKDGNLAINLIIRKMLLAFSAAKTEEELDQTSEKYMLFLQRAFSEVDINLHDKRYRKPLKYLTELLPGVFHIQTDKKIEKTKALIDLLISQGADVNDLYADGSGMVANLYNSYYKDCVGHLGDEYIEDLIRFFISKGANLETKSSEGKSSEQKKLLRLAITNEKFEFAKFLIESGADVNGIDYIESGTDHNVILPWNFIECVMNHSSVNHETIFGLIIRTLRNYDGKHKDDLLETMRNIFKKINSTKEGIEPYRTEEKQGEILSSLSWKDSKMYYLLIKELKLDVSKFIDENGKTILHYFASSLNFEMINIILDNGSFNSLDKQGNTALDLFLLSISQDDFSYSAFKERNKYTNEDVISTFEKLSERCKNFKPLSEKAIQNLRKNDMFAIVKLYEDKLKTRQSYHSL